jgi:hypothetical protein
VRASELPASASTRPAPSQPSLLFPSGRSES